MLLLVFLLLLHENLARPPQVPTPKINGEKFEENPKTLVFSPQFQRQQYFHYDFPLLEPQFYGYPNNKPPVIPARVQPQIVLYHHGNGAIPAAPGQSFLLQPGPLQPPGNFLVPSPPQQSPPFVIAGYPKPAHIPPIEKDAEEIPTNPSKIPPLNSNNGRNKPEKLETFDTEKRIDSAEIDGLAEADRLPTNLHPGQRFFILNGEHLYPSLQNYPYPQKFSQIPAAARENPGDFLLFNQNPEIFGENQPIFEENRGDFDNSYRLINYVDNDSNSEAVVIDSSNHDDNDDNNNNSESDSQDDITATVSGKSDEQPSVSQAQPGAVAIAGPGGVAAAAPRGTAFAGKEGVAVSSPHATAVAGPKPNQPNKEDNNNNNSANNKNSNKKGKRQ